MDGEEDHVYKGKSEGGEGNYCHADHIDDAESILGHLIFVMMGMFGDSCRRSVGMHIAGETLLYALHNESRFSPRESLESFSRELSLRIGEEFGANACISISWKDNGTGEDSGAEVKG